jgi:hypothetical protein
MDRIREAWAKRNPRVLATCAICILVGIGAFGRFDASNQRLYARLNEHGVVVNAVVTDTYLQNHNTACYSFIAGGVSYGSCDFLDPPNPPASELAVGDSLYVVYDATDPNYSCACDPYQLATAWWRCLLLGVGVGCAAALLITLGLQRLRRGSDVDLPDPPALPPVEAREP